MKAWMLKYWDRLRSSLWFVPSIMGVAAVVFALAAIEFDQLVADRWLRSNDLGYFGSVDGARAVVQTIAGSMITLTGLVFSMTLVVLSLTSSQFGPRLLRNFMRSRTNQFVLGTFTATFLYSLIVLSSIRQRTAGEFIPHASVTLAMLIAVASLAVLVHFIHHISTSIQADEIIANVYSELRSVIDRLFPERIGCGRTDDEIDRAALRDFDADAKPVLAASDGYLQLVDGDSLIAIAVGEDVVFRIERRPGHYVVANSPLVMVKPASKWSEELANRVNRAFVLDHRRTPTQDVEFAVEQLVEIAARALSPGINDPFTAISCVDRLTSAYACLAQREFPSPDRYDENGYLRVIAQPTSFPSVLGAAFDPLRQLASRSVPVTVRLLEALNFIAMAASRHEDKDAIWQHAQRIMASARNNFSDQHDIEDALERVESLRQTLQ